ncbi:MAG: hypothetical protein O9294_16410 [Cytophagales bacterium]|nr:hypothetical protein [Cytophagales bacterium]
MQNWITTKTLLDINKNETETFDFKIYTIDSNGQTLDETEFDSDSNTVCKRIYRYFEGGEVEEYIEYDPNDELLERHIYLKNDYGEIDRIEHEFNGGHKSIKEFSYTDLGYSDRAEIRNENGEITGFEIYRLDENGQVIEAVELDADNNELSKLKKEYLTNGLISVEKHYSNGKLHKDEYFEYDDNSNVIKKTLKNYSDNFVVIDQYQYDERNNMIYNCSHQNGLLVSENKCGYNENNHLVSEELFELDFWEKRILRHERLKHELRQ